jgi:CubicO group peptidase (beta-lactamase class C family)
MNQSTSISGKLDQPRSALGIQGATRLLHPWSQAIPGARLTSTGSLTMTVKSVNHCVRFFVLLAGIFSLFMIGRAGPAAIASPVAAPTPAATPSTYWPTHGWRTSSPEEQGMDSQKLAPMLDFVQQQRLSLYSLLVIRNGYLVSETYFTSDHEDTRREIYSCTKSFISTLVGIGIDKGYIDGVNRRVMDFFPGRTFENSDVRKDGMTLDDLLTMRSGLDWEESDAAYVQMYRSTDWIKFVLDKPLKEQPGTEFRYCSGCSHVLSAIIQKATGVNTREFAEKNLFGPLGISDADWDTDASGIPIGGWGLHITPRDMAKLGYLYLRNGIWDSQQIVSAGWVKTATQTYAQVPDDPLDYGYQWWTYPALDAYAALGRFGQTILVIPKLDLIVVTTAHLDSHDPIFKLISSYIIPAVQQP